MVTPEVVGHIDPVGRAELEGRMGSAELVTVTLAAAVRPALLDY
jgi:hypothetical protein